MSNPTSILSVLVGERFACVKVAGRANFNVSVEFKNIITCLHDRGFNYIVIELAECQLMDSTFLGVLAGHGLKACECEQGDARMIELRNANERVHELIENLGVLHLFKTARGESATEGLASPGESFSCAANVTKEEITLASLEAHQTLIALNPENVARFKDVTKFLAEDLEKLRKKK